jgi:hypothetical protein
MNAPMPPLLIAITMAIVCLVYAFLTAVIWPNKLLVIGLVAMWAYSLYRLVCALFHWARQ